MTFEQWLQRPVYVVQCFTYNIAKWQQHGDALLFFRALPGRSGRVKSQAWRNRTAARLWELRRCREGLARREVRDWFNQNVRNKQTGGTAVRCDLQMLFGKAPEMQLVEQDYAQLPELKAPASYIGNDPPITHPLTEETEHGSESESKTT